MNELQRFWAEANDMELAPTKFAPRKVFLPGNEFRTEMARALSRTVFSEEHIIKSNRDSATLGRVPVVIHS